MKSLTAPLHTQEGEQAGEVSLPETVFARPINATMLSEALVSMQKNLHAPTSHAKDRGEVRGGGRKPWRQKGTGRARHGSIRSPIWRGGGVTHGPQKGRVHTRKINKKVKDASLAMALTGKREDDEIYFVDSFALKKTSTKEMVAGLSALLGARYSTGSVLIVVDAYDVQLERSMRNIPHVELKKVQTLSALDVLNHASIVMTKAALEVLQKRLT